MKQLYALGLRASQESSQELTDFVKLDGKLPKPLVTMNKPTAEHNHWLNNSYTFAMTGNQAISTVEYAVSAVNLWCARPLGVSKHITKRLSSARKARRNPSLEPSSVVNSRLCEQVMYDTRMHPNDNEYVREYKNAFSHAKYDTRIK